MTFLGERKSFKKERRSRRRRKRREGQSPFFPPVCFLPRRDDNWLCSCLSWPYLVKSPPNNNISNWRRWQWLAASVKRADRHACVSVLTSLNTLSSAHRSADYNSPTNFISPRFKGTLFFHNPHIIAYTKYLCLFMEKERHSFLLHQSIVQNEMMEGTSVYASCRTPQQQFKYGRWCCFNPHFIGGTWIRVERLLLLLPSIF